MTTGFPGHFTPAQHAQLLAAIKPERVLRDPRGNSHVSQQDVTAHLIRVFGFGNFSTELLDLHCIFENGRPMTEAIKAEPWKQKFDVAYRATMRVTIYDENHNLVTSYEDASVGDAQNQNRQDAHDLAMKSAISLAKKRCCINLGDQFGLSLYNRGQMSALVGGTHVRPEPPKPGEQVADLQADVPQQVSMGHDEVEKSSEATPEQEAQLAASLGAQKVEERPPTAEEAAVVAETERGDHEGEQVVQS